MFFRGSHHVGRTRQRRTVPGKRDRRWRVRLGLKRLFSDKPEAVAIQVYCAVIASLLLAQAVGGRVTMDAFRMLSFYLQAWADEKELLDFLSKLRQREA